MAEIENGGEIYFCCTLSVDNKAISSPLIIAATYLIARFMRPTWGPSGADKTQVGPMLALWTWLSGIYFFYYLFNNFLSTNRQLTLLYRYSAPFYYAWCVFVSFAQTGMPLFMPSLYNILYSSHFALLNHRWKRASKVSAFSSNFMDYKIYSLIICTCN